MLPSKRILLCSWLFVSSAFCGCDTATYTELEYTRHPYSGLVQRRGHEALSSDVYYIVLLPQKHTTKSVVDAVHKNPFITLTRGQHLNIRWAAPDLLIVSSKTPIDAIDVIQQSYKVGSVRVEYFGFPNIH